MKVKTPCRIFVVDTGDLFGKWVPENWGKQVINMAGACPRHTFMFLTKNPARLLEFAFPKNAWVGTSVNSNRDRKKAETIKRAGASVKFLSIEPLLGEVDFDFSGLQWLIVGAQTGKNPLRPRPGWIDKILRAAESHDIPVFMKNNIKPHCNIFMQQYPLKQKSPLGDSAFNRCLPKGDIGSIRY